MPSTPTLPIEDRQISTGQSRSTARAQGLSVDQQLPAGVVRDHEPTQRPGLYQSDLVMYEMDLTEGAILEKGHVYLVPLLERLTLPKDLSGANQSQRVRPDGWTSLPAS